MSKTDRKARDVGHAPTDLSPAAEVKTAMAGFVNDLNDFQDKLNSKLQQQEERLTMLDRKTTTYQRPALSVAAETDAPHQKAFNAYLRSGDDDALRGIVLEGKAMSTAVSADGGYLVDPQTAETIKSVLNSTASLRSIASVVNVEATSFDVLIDHTDVGAGWATEAGPASETGTPSIDRITIPLHELSALSGFDDQVAALEATIGGATAMTAAFDGELSKMRDSLTTTNREVDVLSKGIGRGLKSAFDGLVFDGMKLSDALNKVAESMINATYNAAISPVTKHLGGLIANGISGMIGAGATFEKGGSFTQGRVMPFANGGIVSGPTTFPMRGGTGLMGEAGPEAIMPLTRGANGRLGVEASGGGRPVNITMNISTPDVEGFNRSQGQIAAQLSRALGRGQRNF